MKKNQFLFLTGLVICAAVFLFAFRPAGKSYQHMTIVANNPKLEDVGISIDGKEYSHQRLTREVQGAWDLNPIINLVHQYESEGWELQHFNGDGSGYYFWLRKEK